MNIGTNLINRGSNSIFNLNQLLRDPRAPNMFYQNQPDILIENVGHPIAAVEEVETLNPSNREDPNIIVIDDPTQPEAVSVNMENSSNVSSTTPSRKRLK